MMDMMVTDHPFSALKPLFGDMRLRALWNNYCFCTPTIVLLRSLSGDPAWLGKSAEKSPTKTTVKASLDCERAVVNAR